MLLERHAAYYRVIDVLLTVLTDEFGSAVLYDLHSYNDRTLEGSAPLFNIGCHFIDSSRFGAVVDHLAAELAAVELPGCETRVAIDEVFQGKGYQAEYVRRHHPEVLCLPLEIKKVFMDDRGIDLEQNIFEPLRDQLTVALRRNYEFFHSRIVQLNGDI